jgi:hypothetical protein
MSPDHAFNASCLSVSLVLPEHATRVCLKQ